MKFCILPTASEVTQLDRHYTIRNNRKKLKDKKV